MTPLEACHSQTEMIQWSLECLDHLIKSKESCNMLITLEQIAYVGNGVTHEACETRKNV